MIRNSSGLKGYAIHASDGELGKVEELYFDARTWVVRYVVVNTGGWLFDRKVLIAREALGIPNWNARTIHVQLTREQVRNSPTIDTEQPISREQELLLHRHYAWKAYWEETQFEFVHEPSALSLELAAGNLTTSDMRLRGTESISGRRVHAKDKELGLVNDFILDDESWEIRYMVMESRGFMTDIRKTLIPTQWIDRIDWDDSEVYVDLTAEVLAQSPAYRFTEAFGSEYQHTLDEYYQDAMREHPKRMTA